MQAALAQDSYHKDMMLHCYKILLMKGTCTLDRTLKLVTIGKTQNSNVPISILQATHDRYKKVLEDLWDTQKKCLTGIAHHRYRMKQITEKMTKWGLFDTLQAYTLKKLKNNYKKIYFEKQHSSKTSIK